MPFIEKPLIAVLPYAMRYTDDLAKVKISELIIPLGQKMPDGASFVGDLGESDHLIVYCCWKSLSRDYTNLRCKINLLVSEPTAVQRRYYFLIPFFARKFHSVLTYSDRLIRKIKNGVFHAGASLWVDPDQDFKKNCLVSIIASRKAKTVGQRLRHEVIKSCLRFGIPLDLYGRGYKEVEHKEEALRSYMFSVCIENSSERNYFTEKIVDCMAQKVVPIYWGASNIGEFFNIDGIIVCKSEREILSAIRGASFADYERRVAAIEENFRTASSFDSLDYMAAKKISEFIWRR